eukprot:TRINITY_DN19782_c0_g1_i1.p1 TRINITY_DN19782_c0_g1~~TRINITY_DN19782_c0_g1_i1.p1  ORF type:complete len:628 (-),score=98.01 TRINITY_DN19782_c0_g1_i1:91-1974(-)
MATVTNEVPPPNIQRAVASIVMALVGVSMAIVGFLAMLRLWNAADFSFPNVEGWYPVDLVTDSDGLYRMDLPTLPTPCDPTCRASVECGGTRLDLLEQKPTGTFHFLVVMGLLLFALYMFVFSLLLARRSPLKKGFRMVENGLTWALCLSCKSRVWRLDMWREFPFCIPVSYFLSHKFVRGRFALDSFFFFVNLFFTIFVMLAFLAVQSSDLKGNQLFTAKFEFTRMSATTEQGDCAVTTGRAGDFAFDDSIHLKRSVTQEVNGDNIAFHHVTSSTASRVCYNPTTSSCGQSSGASCSWEEIFRAYEAGIGYDGAPLCTVTRPIVLVDSDLSCFDLQCDIKIPIENLSKSDSFDDDVLDVKLKSILLGILLLILNGVLLWIHVEDERQNDRHMLYRYRLKHFPGDMSESASQVTPRPEYGDEEEVLIAPDHLEDPRANEDKVAQLRRRLMESQNSKTRLLEDDDEHWTGDEEGDNDEKRRVNIFPLLPSQRTSVASLSSAVDPEEQRRATEERVRSGDLSRALPMHVIGQGVRPPGFPVLQAGYGRTSAPGAIAQSGTQTGAISISAPAEVRPRIIAAAVAARRLHGALPDPRQQPRIIINPSSGSATTTDGNTRPEKPPPPGDAEA